MRRLVEFSVNNRVLVNLLTLFILGAGVVTYLQMHRVTPTAYDLVRRPRCVLLVINTTSANRGGNR